MDATEIENWRETGRVEGREFIAADREEAHKAYRAWKALVAIGRRAFTFEADFHKAEGFCEVAAVEFASEGTP